MRRSTRIKEREGSLPKNGESISDKLAQNELVKENVSEVSSSEENEEHNKSVEKKTAQQNIGKDLKNIMLLMYLYFLQGIPLGLTGSLPLILTSHKVSYTDLGTFSFAFWPFSLKLLWAPIVDSLYFKKIGKRKSWLIPIQYLIGIFMIIFSGYIKELLDGKLGDGKSNIYILTFIFFMFTFLAATQDIAVDGWALTMLSKENVSWASTCNTVGQTAGWFIGNVLFLTVESADFSNKYLRPLLSLSEQSYGLVTIDKFMYFFGLVFLISTTLVFVLKREDDLTDEVKDEVSGKPAKKAKSLEENLTVKQTYKLMLNILWLMPIRKLLLVLLTVKVSFAAESMSYVKLVEAGVPKEKLGLLAIPLTPLQIILPLIISRYTNGPYPFNFYIKAIPLRLVSGICVAIWVYFTPSFKDANNEYPFYYYMLCLVINAIHSIFTYSMFVSQMAFFSKIVDKRIGGTYVTFLNTCTNMGESWPGTAALYLASFLGVNAYYYETVAFCFFGIIWLTYFKKVMYNLQDLPKKSWMLLNKA